MSKKIQTPFGPWQPGMTETRELDEEYKQRKSADESILESEAGRKSKAIRESKFAEVFGHESESEAMRKKVKVADKQLVEKQKAIEKAGPMAEDMALKESALHDRSTDDLYSAIALHNDYQSGKIGPEKLLVELRKLGFC